MDEFVETDWLSSFLCNIPVFDLVNRPEQLRLDTGLLAHLAQGGRLGVLALVYQPLRKLPTSLRPNRDERDFDAFAHLPESDPTG